MAIHIEIFEGIRMTKSFTFLKIFLVIIIVAELSAQEDVFFDRIDVPQGLSSSNVRSICQDQYGYLWIGTDDGLNRYDGYKFDVFKNDLSHFKENMVARSSFSPR